MEGSGGALCEVYAWVSRRHKKVNQPYFFNRINTKIHARGWDDLQVEFLGKVHASRSTAFFDSYLDSYF